MASCSTITPSLSSLEPLLINPICRLAARSMPKRLSLGGSRMMSCRMDWRTCMFYETLWVMHVFGESSNKDVVIWTTMINGYENCCDMEHHNPKVVHFNAACWALAKPYYTYWKSHIMCISWCIGPREMATVLYEEMQDKNVYAFTSLLSGLSNNGLNLRSNNGCPNRVTLLCVLRVCITVCFVEHALRILENMKMSTLSSWNPSTTVVLERQFTWRGRGIVRQMLEELDSYVLEALFNTTPLLSNIYETMKNKRVGKMSRCSVIEVNGAIYEFSVGKRTHHNLIQDKISCFIC
ncbi:LOW QUALITY PROTEIN: hypothetical protein V2J09_009196 [Rumex salicifolius]